MLAMIPLKTASEIAEMATKLNDTINAENSFLPDSSKIRAVLTIDQYIIFSSGMINNSTCEEVYN